jgi:hypothetical protein
MSKLCRLVDETNTVEGERRDMTTKFVQLRRSFSFAAAAAAAAAAADTSEASMAAAGTLSGLVGRPRVRGSEKVQHIQR